MRDFRKFSVWIQAVDLVAEVYQLASLLPKTEEHGLRSQLQRAAVSIASNIAEGASRSSELEFKRFLGIAIGSSFELETQLILIQKLKMLSSDQLKDVFDHLRVEQKMLNSVISKLKPSRSKNPVANS
jgi:four helix bundle protein